LSVQLQPQLEHWGYGIAFASHKKNCRHIRRQLLYALSPLVSFRLQESEH